MLLEKRADLLQPRFDLLDRRRIVIGLQRLRRPRPGQHHQELRAKLLQRPGQFLALRVLGDKVKYGQVAFRIPDHAGIILQLEQADVAVMILQGFELKPGAILPPQFEAFVAAVVRRNVFVEPRPIVFEQGSMAERPLAIGPPLHIHLQQAQIQPKLNPLTPVLRFEPARNHLTRLILPLVQEMRYIEIHRAIWRRGPGKSTIAQEKAGACHARPFPPQQRRMSSLVHVAIHASQFPENVRRDLLESLRARRVNHKFLYDSVKQTQQWLALHQAFSPSRTDADCAATYDRSFAAAARRINPRRVHLIGLGCGGGQKDTRLLKLLQVSGRSVFYTPSDVSTAMVLTARQTATAVVPAGNCFPLVCDLGTADDLPAMLDALPVANAARLITFFGMIPNFEPQVILPRLAGLIRPQDHLLFSANLAPGPDYAAGVQRILPLYDNTLTRDWLMTFLLDLGVEATDGELRFDIEDDPGGSGLKRVAAYFRFTRPREIAVDAQRFLLAAGELFRLFFSWRHTPALVRNLLGQHALGVLDEWITESGEEGVFLVSRA